MFDIGGPELLVILLGIIVLFGPKKIPEVAQMIGKGIQKVRTAQTQFKEQIDEIQTELSVISKTDFNVNSEPKINEIRAIDLQSEHFTTNKNLLKPEIEKSEEEILIPNSVEKGFSPVYSNIKEDPYNLDTPEKEDSDTADSHLNGNSHGLQG